MSTDVTDFQTQVLDRSQQLPVLVDFWAPWCGPCRVLGPILDNLASQSDGAWELAKVNTDQYPEVSMQYGIQGIPAVKLFSNGEVVDEFTGALPEYAVKQWLEKALPSENKGLLERVRNALLMDDTGSARTMLEEILSSEPTHPEASVMLAGLIVFDDPERAEALIGAGSFAGPGMVMVEEAVRNVARLARMDLADLPEGDASDAYRRAVEALRAQNFDTALDLFVAVIQKNRYYDDDGARKACVAIFTLLGEDHPITQKHRRTFNMVLY